MKSKFRLHFANGEVITDANKFQKLSGLETWIRNHNRGERSKGWKIERVTRIKAKINKNRASNPFKPLSLNELLRM